MRALRLIADRKLELADVQDPPPPGGDGEVQIRIKAVALNHLDLWGFRGMAFAKRKLPLVVGAEASGEIAAIGAGVTTFKAGDKVVAAISFDNAGKAGRPAGEAWVLSEKDGAVVSKTPLPGAPAFEGLSIAEGAVYVSLQDGSVVRLEKKGQ